MAFQEAEEWNQVNQLKSSSLIRTRRKAMVQDFLRSQGIRITHFTVQLLPLNRTFVLIDKLKERVMYTKNM